MRLSLLFVLLEIEVRKVEPIAIRTSITVQRKKEKRKEIKNGKRTKREREREAKDRRRLSI